MSKPIEDFLKCDICKNYFDLNSHRPLIAKCGHTFCKHCILSNKGEENNNSCPIDKQEYVLSIESCINNLKLEDIVKNVFNLEEQKTISQKQIIYVKPDIKRNRSPSLKHNNIDNNGNYVNKAKFRSSTSNKYSSDFFSKKDNIGKLNMKKINIDNDENKNDDIDDSIETIPLNEDKSVMNISFKDEWTAILGKNLLEKKLSKGEKELFNNNNVEDTLDKISKIDDEFIPSSIANLIPNSTNKNNINNIHNNNPINNNAYKIQHIKKITKNINIEPNILKYATNTYNSKNRNVIVNKGNSSMDKQSSNKNNNSNVLNNNNINNNNKISNNTSNYNNNNIVNSSITPRKDENDSNPLLQTYNKIKSQPYHKTVITNKSLQSRFNMSKNDDSRKETEENIHNNRSLANNEDEIKKRERLLEMNINDKIDENIKIKNSNEKNFQIIISASNEKKNLIHQIPIDLSRNSDEKNIISKSYAENENKNNIGKLNKISIIDSQRRKNSDYNSETKFSLNTISTGKLQKSSREFNLYNIQKSNTQSVSNLSTPTNNFSNTNSNSNIINYSENHKKIPKGNNLIIQNFENSTINNTLDNSTIMKNFSHNEISLKLKNELLNLLGSDGTQSSIKRIEETGKYKKFSNYIEKALSNQKFKSDQQIIKLKLYPNNDFFIGYLDTQTEDPLNGILYSNNGDYYEGEFLKGKKEGYGIIIYKNGTRYEGIFKNNKHNGYGKLIQLDGEVFIGDWKEGKINGKGVRYHSNGDRYIGSYVNNIRNGQGHYIFSNGDAYEGNWTNGKANGKGKFTFKNGNIYEGEFKDNIICGKGKFTMKNGDVYSGNFKNGLINGKGTLKTEKGEKYSGYFLNGKKHGMGKLVDKDGNEVANGYWNMDVFVGKKNINEYM